MTDDDQTLASAASILDKRMRKPGYAIKHPADASLYLRVELGQLDYESFRVMFLDARHSLISLKEMFRGTIDGAAVYPREVVKAALHFNASAVILTHNHPSGVCEPSAADRAITKRLKDALDLVDVRVLDHIVVGHRDTFSFASNGLL